MTEKTLVFLPTFNDFTELDKLVSNIRNQLPNCDVLIVDDGSYKSFMPAGSVFHVRIPFNLGLGVATHIAMDFALFNNYDYLIRLDADGQHNTLQLPDFLSQLKQDSDIVIGNRKNRHNSKGIKNILKILIHNYFYYLARFTTSQKIPTDLNSGYLGFNKKAITALNSLELERYPEPQIVLFGATLQLRLGEIMLDQKPRLTGSSTIAYWQTLRLLFRFSMYSFILVIRKKIL